MASAAIMAENTLLLDFWRFRAFLYALAAWHISYFKLYLKPSDSTNPFHPTSTLNFHIFHHDSTVPPSQLASFPNIPSHSPAFRISLPSRHPGFAMASEAAQNVHRLPQLAHQGQGQNALLLQDVLEVDLTNWTN